MSPKFSALSTERLEECDSILQFLFQDVIQAIDCTILCGHRNEEEQRAAFLSGASKLDWPQSKHNAKPSRAVDARPYYPGNREPVREELIHFGGIVKGIAFAIGVDIRWGGDWDSDNDLAEKQWEDLYHFELVGKK